MTFRQTVIDRSLYILLGLLGSAAFLIGAAWITANAMLAPVCDRETDPVLVEIPARASTGQIGAILADKGLIRNATAFRLYARFRRLDAVLKAGEYELSPSLSTPEIIEILAQGRARLVAFTIPEGLTLKQTAVLLADRGFVDADVFTRLLDEKAASHPLLSGLPEEQRSLEGYLFPDTYMISIGTSEEQIIRLLLARFEEETARLDLERRAAAHGLNLHEAVTLASLIEREARVAEERRVISGVLHNRLKRNMLLQVDATIIYALGDFDRQVVLYRDLEVDSPYNTYRYSGLPPGPIASPGRDSLIAAVDPDQHDYLYYVAKPDGTHAFSRTLAEHNANKRRYLP
ncbi:endolytic transglycosylase MltG [Candidatus Desulforudis audaxviator]|uniref:Endolytic murein transglycosylase n=1 Tax=Desulforudis audaxviator (strain MP104C) TaxID=477974 RepID=B1I376_DESAP|nr:endolytic transglycosylase MltG [Candidatus Desulforudis audaxviator]ACA59431.1 aminodeoxychorismate lyase [Candidatus Desulforudis audaxviator MP104C]AZK59413.1 protein YceG like [Candidatus Desulforudis audaxviator]